MQFYGINLLAPPDTFTGTLFIILVGQLPSKSRTLAKINPATLWDTETCLLADIADSLRFLAWCKTPEASDGGTWNNHVRRPWEEDTPAQETEEEYDFEEAFNYFDKLRRGGEQK